MKKKKFGFFSKIRQKEEKKKEITMFLLKNLKPGKNEKLKFKKMEIKVIVLMVLLLVTVCFTKSTLRLGKLSHKVSREAESLSFLNKYRSSSNSRVGNSIPLIGGYVNLGTYYLTVSIGSPAKNYTVLVRKIRNLVNL